jgi:hypothetical protein
LQAVTETNYSGLDEHAYRGRSDMRHAGPASARVPAPPARALFDILAATAAPKGHAAVEQSLGGASVVRESRVLVKDVSVPVKAKRFQSPQNVGRSAFGLAQRIDVIDTHEPFAARLARMQVACDGGRQRSEV